MSQTLPPHTDASQVDAQNRHIAQQAGLDQDLESQVPPRYDTFTLTIMGVILIMLAAAIVWMII
jgi:hypothetical protein